MSLDSRYGYNIFNHPYRLDVTLIYYVETKGHDKGTKRDVDEEVVNLGSEIRQLTRELTNYLYFLGS